MRFCIFSLCLACASVILMISKVPLTSLTNVWILADMGRIQDILQTLQYTKPIADPLVFLNLD